MLAEEESKKNKRERFSLITRGSLLGLGGEGSWEGLPGERMLAERGKKIHKERRTGPAVLEQTKLIG